MEINTLIWQIFMQIVLIAANAVFACAEIAVVSMNDTKIEKMAAEKNKKAMKLQWLTSQPSRFLSTIQIAITLSGFLGSAFAADNFADYFIALAQNIGLDAYVSVAVIRKVSVVIITLILSYVTLIFGELVPKRVAMNKTETIALGLAGLLTFVAKLFAPIVWLLSVSTSGVLRLIGIDPNEEDDEVTEEEIRMMVDAGSEKVRLTMMKRNLSKTYLSLMIPM